MLLAPFLLWLAAGSAPGEPRLPATAAVEDVSSELARLSDRDGGVRRDAERWLARNVGPEHATALAEAALAGDPEVRLRIARVVADASPDLWLATLFLGREDEVLADLGERALRARVARWSTEAALEPLVAHRFQGLEGVGPYHDAVRETASRSWPQTVRLEVEGSLEDACARLMRRGHMPLGVAVDPDLEARTRNLAGAAAPTPAREAVLEGTWDVLLVELASRFRVGLEAHGMVDEVPVHAGPTAFVCFRPERQAGHAGTDELLIEWCRLVLADGEPARRAAAARALAAVRWPSAVEWLGQRWLRLGDAAALEGLLRAAGEGRVASALADPERWPELLDRIQRGLVSTDATRRRWSERALDGLSDLPAVGGRARAVLEGWPSLAGDAIGDSEAEAARWMRLVILEGMGGVVGGPPAREVLESAGASPRLLRQALRTWVASMAGAGDVDGGPPVLASPETLLRLPADREEALELVGLLRAADIAPPQDWRDPARAPSAGALLQLAWWALRRDPEAAGAHWSRIAVGSHARVPPAELAAFVAPLALERGATWVRAWELARQGGAKEAVDRAALLAGILPRARSIELFRTLAGSQSLGGVDVELAGVAATWLDTPYGDRARDELVTRWMLALSDDRDPVSVSGLIGVLAEVLGALERDDLALTRAVEGDSVSAAFRRRVEGALRAHRRTRIAAALGGTAFPRRSTPPVSLGRQDRRW